MDLSLCLQMLTRCGPILGPLFLALVFYLWKDWKRELRLQERIEALEKEQKEVVLPLVEKCASIIADNTTALARLEKVIGHMGFLQAHAERNLLDRLVSGIHEPEPDVDP
jgi:hypothetical protein